MLLPFQFCVSSGTSVSEARLYTKGGVLVADILSNLKENGLVVKSYTGFKLVKYPGTLPVNAIKHEGQYYIRLRLNSGKYFYSDIFTVYNRVDDYLELEYSNSYNFELKNGMIDFSDSFKFKCYLPTQIGKPEYDFEEEATERMGYTFIESQVSKKIYKFTFLAPEYLCDALRIVRLCNYKQITSKDKVYDLTTFNMKPEWEEQGDLAAVECEFETEWSSNETHHWEECACGDKKDNEAHKGGTATETEKAKCEVCGKDQMRASNLSYRSSQLTRRTLTHKKANVQKVTIVENGTPTKKYVCTKCLKSKDIVRA